MRRALLLSIALGLTGTGGVAEAAPRGCVAVRHGAPVTVPRLAGRSLDSALDALLARGLRASVREFPPIATLMPEQGFGLLDVYRVVAQSARAGSRLARGRAVALTLNAPRFNTPLGSIGVPAHPGTATMPDLVGDDYGDAVAAARAVPGIWIEVGSVGPLTAAASECGLNGLVVVAQSPAPGTVVPAYGATNGSVEVSLATVSVDLAGRAP
jgi:hypothetical protein